jgi:nicotinic acid mononucleotide adenylyltransferase
VSSTEIRRRLQAREPVAHLVTARVSALLAER